MGGIYSTYSTCLTHVNVQGIAYFSSSSASSRGSKSNITGCKRQTKLYKGIQRDSGNHQWALGAIHYMGWICLEHSGENLLVNILPGLLAAGFDDVLDEKISGMLRSANSKDELRGRG